MDIKRGSFRDTKYSLGDMVQYSMSATTVPYNAATILKLPTRDFMIGESIVSPNSDFSSFTILKSGIYHIVSNLVGGNYTGGSYQHAVRKAGVGLAWDSRPNVGGYNADCYIVCYRSLVVGDVLTSTLYHTVNSATVTITGTLFMGLVG